MRIADWFLKKGKNMKRDENHKIMKQMKNPLFQIVESGKQLELDIEQIDSILNDTQHTTEHVSFHLGPPLYGGAFYGAISINDFNILKKEDMIT